MSNLLRTYAVAGIALMGAGLVTTTPAATGPLRVQMPRVHLASDSGSTIGLIMGPSGDPIPGTDYVNDANNLFIDNPLHPNFPGTSYPGVLANGLFTPEGLYGIDGVKQLVYNFPPSGLGDALGAGGTSIGQGVTILDNNIQSNIAAGQASTVFGYSQSTTIATDEMQQLDPSGTPSDLPVQFLLIADVNNPNGGLWERFDGLTLSSSGLAFNGATPADDFITDIYTREYDGAADFPRYPLNFLADLNAWYGFLDVHSNYMPNPAFDPEFSSPSASDIANAILLPGSRDLATPDSLTNYYMIPTENLPLLDPLRTSPLGNAIADLLQPDLKVLVNLGYGDPEYGWSTAPANVPTPIGLFPSLSDLEKVPALLASGTEKGIQAFDNDLSHLSLSSLATSPAADAATQPATMASESPIDFIHSLSGALGSLYSTLLPLTDLMNSALTDMPAYDAQLFMENIDNPLNAIGLPIAADVAWYGVFLPEFAQEDIQLGIDRAMSFFS